MFGIKDFGLFIALSWMLIITPGPDIIYVLTRGISNGRKAGLISATGVTLGLLVHTLFAALGLSIILKTSAIAFTVVKLSGAVYLVYLGIKTILEKKKINIVKTEVIKTRKIFVQGILSNVLNPKVALFFMAFLPQFITINGHYSTSLQLIILGLVFAIFGFIFLIVLGYFSGWVGKQLMRNYAFARRLQNISGMILILLGIRLAFIKRK